MNRRTIITTTIATMYISRMMEFLTVPFCRVSGQ